MSIKAFFKRIPSVSKVTNVSTVTNVIKPKSYEKGFQSQKIQLKQQQIPIPVARDQNLRSLDEIRILFDKIVFFF